MYQKHWCNNCEFLFAIYLDLSRYFLRMALDLSYLVEEPTGENMLIKKTSLRKTSFYMNSHMF